MAWEAQRPEDGLVGELAVGCTDLDTQISAAVFSNLPTDYSQGLYIPLILADDSTDTYEIVYGYQHVATSSSITVSRGMRGTTARTWPQGTVIRCAPTTYDTAAALTFGVANQLPDAYVGQRVIDPNMQALLSKSQQGPFYGHVQFQGGALGASVELNKIPAAGASPLMQAGHVVGLTTNGGFMDWTLPAGPFPNGIASVQATIYTIATDSRIAYCKVAGSFGSGNGSKMTVGFYNSANVLVGNGIAANASMLVIGW